MKIFNILILVRTCTALRQLELGLIPALPTCPTPHPSIVELVVHNQPQCHLKEELGVNVIPFLPLQRLHSGTVNRNKYAITEVQVQ